MQQYLIDPSIFTNEYQFGQTTDYFELEAARSLAGDHQVVLSIFPTLYKALYAYEHLTATEDVLFFGADEFISAQLLSASPELLYERIISLDTIAQYKKANKKIWIITHVAAITRPIMTEVDWNRHTITLKPGDTFARDPFIETLVMLGYERVALVEKIGEFAVRGEVIDIYSPKHEHPIRLSFFDIELEVCYFFDVTTKQTISQTNEVTVLPVIDQLSVGANIESVSLMAYFNNPVLIEHNTTRIADTYRHMLEDAMQFKDKDETAQHVESLFISLESIRGKTTELYTFSPLSDGNRLMGCVEIGGSGKTSDLLSQEVSRYAEEAYKIVFLIGNYAEKKAKEMVKEKMPFLDVNKVSYREDLGYNELWPQMKTVIVDFNECFNVDVSRQHQEKRVFQQIDMEAQLQSLQEIEPGDYVVHEQHGIARYDGVQQITAQGVERDYIVLSYKDDEKVYVPVEKVTLLYRYTAGKEGFTPKRSSLGNNTWQKRTERVKEHVEEFAQELFKLYMERERIEGYQFSPDTPLQIEFEKAFPYTETDDQLEAIKEIKTDMEAPFIMERLLCGDVGFGKTEVAFRAAMKAMEDGKQVAMLAPTTILARQHFENAVERFAPFGKKVGMLSRLVSKKEQDKYLFDLEVGELDLVIGTHRLLSKDVTYDDLGLVIIDEEHRFGVKDKERLKQLKTNVDVLLISATPIPRTLQMSITGIRALSLLQTAPYNRYPVQTYVVEQNDNLIKDAIERELSRKGQTYFLYNRVQSIEKMTKKIHELVPDARVGFAHGQMSKTQLEDIIQSFIDKEIDVLVSTTIIENGMDIPNANTLIVYEADLLGLAQLYQLRGRVGRSDRIAYSYFMYNGRNVLTEEALKRLQTIQSFTEFGSGYHIAMRDLAIRGAGDVLGKTQSGYIDDVGFDLYLDMLQSAISENQQLMTGSSEQPVMKTKSNEIEVTLAIPSYVPNDYVSDESVKILIYQKMNEIESYGSMKSTITALEDQYGRMPDILENLCYVFLFRKIGVENGLQSIRQVRNKVTLRYTKVFTGKLNRLLVNQTIRGAGYDVGIEYKMDVLHIHVTTMRKNPKEWLEEISHLLEIVTQASKPQHVKPKPSIFRD